MLYFTTLFDVNYLSRGLCLIESLTNVLGGEFSMFVLALDDETVNYFASNPNEQITVITLAQIEAHFEELAIAKSNRKKIEYYFTLSPALPLYILEVFEECDRITSLDADVFFFDSPKSFFDTVGDDEVLITPHDFSPQLAHLAQYGLFNVSFQSFPRTVNGINVLKDWKQDCLAWCNDYHDPETGYFADQKYLDDWNKKFSNIKSISLKTFGRAPWNISDTNLLAKGEKFYVDGEPLVYYHFHNLRLKGNLITHDLQNYNMPKLTSSIKKLYKTYIKLLDANNQKIGLITDKGVIRYNTPNHKESLISSIWQHQNGAILTPFHGVLFFNIQKLKSKYQSFLNYTSGKFN
ncbi:MAG: glycosyltransferase [Bacteroidia bacterium]